MASTIKLNVYEIGDYTIAAKGVKDAFSVFFDQLTEIESVVDCDEPKEGETETLTLEVYKFTEEEIKTRSFPCCDDECRLCEGTRDKIFTAIAEIIAENKEPWAFVIASPN